jgi:hypothetical protein
VSTTPGQDPGLSPGQGDSLSRVRLPGVRYRPEERVRHVEHTVGGETRVVPVKETAWVPVPPRDWDTTVLAAVTALSVVLVLASVVWSTASIGALFSRATVPEAAYAAAFVFDAGWITFMAMEWLARYDRQRAKAPRRAGWACLGLAMGAVCVHGALEASLWVGVAGAAVSAIAKGVYSAVVAFHSRPLGERDQAWLRQREAELTTGLAVSQQQRLHDRMQARLDLLRPTAPQASAASAPRPVAVPEAAPAVAVERDSVRELSAVLSSLVGQVAELRGQAVAAPTVPPATVPVPPVPDSPPRVPPSAQGEEREPAERPKEKALRLVPGQPSVRDTIREALLEGVADTDTEALRERVAEVHGEVSGGTFRKSRLRAMEDVRKRAAS